MRFFEQYRTLISLLLGVFLSTLVLLFWISGQRNRDDSLQGKVADTNTLVMQQLNDVLMQNVHLLENLKSRLEFTNGDFFAYWSEDAKSIIQQEPSFKFVEWIDSSMVIQRIEPLEGNEEALGLDISTIDYRRADWNSARKDSVFNLTSWVELTQGDHAFLVDEPVYFDGTFQGTITAGMNFSRRFNAIMQGLEEYHVEVADGDGTTFYSYGSSEGTEAFSRFTVTDSFQINDANASTWSVTMVPNHLFAEMNAIDEYNIDLILALILCVILATTFFYMLKASAAEKSLKRTNRNLRALIDSAPIAIYVIDAHGRVVDFWNDAAEEMLGWKKEEVMGKMLPVMKNDNADAIRANLSKGIADGGIAKKEIIRPRKDGSKGRFLLHLGSITGNDRHMLVLLEDITKEKEIEGQLKESLHEKEILLREVHHRVKNNLAIMVGLLELQADETEDQKSRHLLNEIRNRIFSIFEVHELLYQTKDFSKINFADYLEKLVERIKSSYRQQNARVDFRTHIDDASININLAIPLGLLLNELITNSLLHAFDHTRHPAIEIVFKEQNGSIEIEYWDNGKGMTKDFFMNGNSMGLTIIRTLLRQLAAEYTLGEADGFNITFRFLAKTKGSHSNL